MAGSQKSSIKHQASSSKHQASTIKHHAASIKQQASSIKQQASIIKPQASSTEPQASSTKRQASNQMSPVQKRMWLGQALGNQYTYILSYSGIMLYISFQVWLDCLPHILPKHACMLTPICNFVAHGRTVNAQCSLTLLFWHVQCSWPIVIIRLFGPCSHVSRKLQHN